jgi:AbrB family looped-hinge helix DNA binding protein
METVIGKITSKGQTTIPASLRKALNLSAGDEVIFESSDDIITIRKAQPLDIAYYKALQASFSSEWESPEDDEAFNEL